MLRIQLLWWVAVFVVPSWSIKLFDVVRDQHNGYDTVYLREPHGITNFVICKEQVTKIHEGVIYDNPQNWGFTETSFADLKRLMQNKFEISYAGSSVARNKRMATAARSKATTSTSKAMLTSIRAMPTSSYVFIEKYALGVKASYNGSECFIFRPLHQFYTVPYPEEEVQPPACDPMGEGERGRPNCDFNTIVQHMRRENDPHGDGWHILDENYKGEKPTTFTDDDKLPSRTELYLEFVVGYHEQ